MPKPRAQGVKAYYWRARLVAIAGILTLVTGPAVVTTAEHAAAANANNWAGPGCPGASNGWNCTGTNGATQNASGAGHRNHANCTASERCDVTQTASNGAVNEAVCNRTKTTSGTDACTFHQTNDSGSNTASVQMAAYLSAQSANVTQTSDQQMTVTQVNTLGPNSATGDLTINQSATGNTSGTITHIQEARQLIELNQQNTSNANNATLTLKDNMASSAKGRSPRQEQNTGSGYEPLVQCDPGGTKNPDGLIHLVQQNGTGSSSKNNAKIRGNANQSQVATSLSNGATQLQGHSRGGFMACLEIDPSGTVDLGSPGTNDGLVKNQAQHANLQGNPPGTLTHSQLDPLLIGILGSSPANVTSNSLSNEAGDPGVFQTCVEQATGHADTLWSGQLRCNQSDGQKGQTKTLEFSGQNIDETLACQQNTGEAGFSSISGSSGCTTITSPPPST